MKWHELAEHATDRTGSADRPADRDLICDATAKRSPIEQAARETVIAKEGSVHHEGKTGFGRA